LIELGAAPAAGGLAAFALMFDNGLLVQTRIVALDGVLVAATLGALILILRALRSRGRPRRSMLALGAGALVGLAAGTKVTGLLAGGLAALCVVAEMRRQPTASRSRDALSIAVWTLSGAVFVYLLGWYLHFVLLPLPGPGDIWGPPSGRFVHDLVMLHRQMMSAQVELARVHAYSSPWWGWPWMSRPVLYWSQQESVMYFVGNPVVWWGSSLLLMALFVTTILGRLGLTSLPVDSDDRPRRLWIPLTAWLLAWSPLAAIPLILFLYHYLTPMVFAVCSVTLWADRLGFTRPGSWRQQRAGYDVALGLILLGFILASPFSFSFVEAETWTRTVFGWLTEWR
jgi:dolichyl-phosphate-mannose--protein O-mannosyl transferase